MGKLDSLEVVEVVEADQCPLASLEAQDHRVVFLLTQLTPTELEVTTPEAVARVAELACPLQATSHRTVVEVVEPVMMEVVLELQEDRQL